MAVNCSEQQQKLEARLEDFYSGWMEMSFANGQGFTEWWNEYFSKDCPGIIRSSGNPLSPQLWQTMISSEDVEYQRRDKQKIVSVDSCLVFAEGKAAVMVFTADMYFSYKGIQNEDRAKISLTWEQQKDEQWKIVHFQRATGQPIPKTETEQ